MTRTRGPWATLLTWETLPTNKFVQSYDYTSTLVKSKRNKRIHISFLRKELSFSYIKNHETPLAKRCFVANWFTSCQCIFINIAFKSHWKRMHMWSLIWTNKIVNPFIQGWWTRWKMWHTYRRTACDHKNSAQVK